MLLDLSLGTSALLDPSPPVSSAVPVPVPVPIPVPSLLQAPPVSSGPSEVSPGSNHWLLLVLGALVLLAVGFLLCAVLIRKVLHAEHQEDRMDIPFVQRWLRSQIEPVPPAELRLPSDTVKPVPEARKRGYLTGASPAASTRSGVAADARQAGSAGLLAVSVVGEGHVVESTVREDAYAAAMDGKGCWVLAVADGVSGSTNSHLAADAAVSLVVSQVDSQTPWTEVPAILARHLMSAIELGRAGGRLERSVMGDKQVQGSPDPKATLTIARVVPTPGGLLHVDLAAVGNSSVLRLGRDGRLVELLDLRERPDGSTAALPSGNPSWQLGHTTLTRTDCLVLCSDGFERLYAENDLEFLDIAFDTSPAWDRLASLVALMTKPAQGDYDDRTIMVLRSESESA